MERRTTKAAVIAAALSLLLFVLALSGCTGTKYREISDPTGWFHIAVPENWQADTSTGALLIYAKDSLPETEDEGFESLSIMVLTSTEASTTAVPDELVSLVSARAKARGWTEFESSDPAKIEIGGREAYAVDVTAKDDRDRAFAGRVALIRTSDQEALIVCLAPDKTWDSHVDAVDELFAQWYWQRAAETTENEPAQ